MTVEMRYGDYRITTDPNRIDRQAVHQFLARSYWSPDLPRDFVDRALQHSLCFSILREDQQVGFARVVTDYATFAYLCDVYVLEAHRGQGLSKQLLRLVMEHPGLQHLRRFLLATRDAYQLYRQFGFQQLESPETYMEIFRPDAHRIP